jgi:hypothetical protein
MLAVDFVHWYVERAAWYKVDAPDMSLPVFIEYFVASAARVCPGFGRQTLEGSVRKGQVEGLGKGDIRGQVRFVESLFKVAA